MSKAENKGLEYLLCTKFLDISQPHKDANSGDVEEVNGGALKGSLKGCRQISSLLARCKGSSWRPRLELNRRRGPPGAENKKFGDYQH